MVLGDPNSPCPTAPLSSVLCVQMIESGCFKEINDSENKCLEETLCPPAARPKRNLFYRFFGRMVRKCFLKNKYVKNVC